MFEQDVIKAVAELRSLSVKDSSDRTEGHRIAKAANDETTTNFLNQLLRLAKKDLRAVVDLLRIQDKNGRTIGHWIVKKQKPARVEQFLGLLDFIAELDPISVSDLLKIQNDMGKTIGQGIKEPSVHLFLNLLRKLATKKARDIARVLLIQDDSRVGIVHSLVEQSDETVQDLIDLLLDLHSENSRRVLKILSLTDQADRTIGHVIAGSCDAETTEEFLYLLSAIAQLRALDVLDLLSRQDKQGSTIGHHIVTNDDDTFTNLRSFLHLLRFLAQSHPQKVLELFDILNENKATIGSSIPSKIGTAEEKELIEFIISLGHSSPFNAFKRLVQFGKYDISTTAIFQNKVDPKILEEYLSLLEHNAGLVPETVLFMLTERRSCSFETQVQFFFWQKNSELNFRLLTILHQLMNTHPDGVNNLLNPGESDGLNRTITLSIIETKDSRSLKLYAQILKKVGDASLRHEFNELCREYSVESGLDGPGFVARCFPFVSKIGRLLTSEGSAQSSNDNPSTLEYK